MDNLTENKIVGPRTLNRLILKGSQITICLQNYRPVRIFSLLNEQILSSQSFGEESEIIV